MAACLAAASCAADEFDAARTAIAPSDPAPPAAETTAAPTTLPPTTTTAVPEPVATTTTTSNVPVTSAPTPTTTTAPEDVTAEVTETRTELDFRIDPDLPEDEEPTEWVIGENVAPGLWQWSERSAANCIFLVAAPALGLDGPRYYGIPADLYRFLDAREPVALVDGEVIIGYSAIDDFSDIIGGTSHPQCFLEWTAHNDEPEPETFADRYGDLDKWDPDDWSTASSGWTCHAHEGPEPADRLDWTGEFGSAQPEASCEVGVGILPGWWQWGEQSAPDCIYVVVDTGDGLGQALHESRARRDARSPILLSDGEIVLGYSDTQDEPSSFVAATSSPVCILEHRAPEDQPSS